MFVILMNRIENRNSQITQYKLSEHINKQFVIDEFVNV